MNDVINTINNRGSLRQFSNDAVKKEHIDLIINSALRAPTAGNLMFYSIIKIENKDTLEKLSITCDHQAFIKTASFALIFVVDYKRIYDYFSQNNYLSFCAEQDIEPQYPGLAELMLGSQDAMAAAQNSVIAAESLNVGSCYIGDIIENYEVHRDLLNLHPLTYPLSMLVFGNYPKEYTRRITPKFDRKYIVFDEKYRPLTQEEITEVYSGYNRFFVENNKTKAKNAAQFLYARKIGSEFNKEMTRSALKAYDEWLKYAKDSSKIFEEILEYGKNL